MNIELFFLIDALSVGTLIFDHALLSPLGVHSNLHI